MSGSRPRRSLTSTFESHEELEAALKTAAFLQGFTFPEDAEVTNDLVRTLLGECKQFFGSDQPELIFNDKFLVRFLRFVFHGAVETAEAVSMNIAEGEDRRPGTLGFYKLVVDWLIKEGILDEDMRIIREDFIPPGFDSIIVTPEALGTALEVYSNARANFLQANDGQKPPKRGELHSAADEYVRLLQHGVQVPQHQPVPRSPAAADDGHDMADRPALTSDEETYGEAVDAPASGDAPLDEEEKDRQAIIEAILEMSEAEDAEAPDEIQQRDARRREAIAEEALAANRLTLRLAQDRERNAAMARLTAETRFEVSRFRARRHRDKLQEAEGEMRHHNEMMMRYALEKNRAEMDVSIASYNVQAAEERRDRLLREHRGQDSEDDDQA